MTARQILDKIISVPGKANAELKHKLEKVALTIKVFVSEEMDGKCQYDGKFGILTISLSEGCFGKHKNALGMVMGHEMGHFIDAWNVRPSDGAMGSGYDKNNSNPVRCVLAF